MPILPNGSSPVPVVVAIGALAVALTALGVNPNDVRGITAELACLATGYAIGRSGHSSPPGV